MTCAGLCWIIFTDAAKSEIQELLEYPENSAGRIMTTEFLSFHLASESKTHHGESGAGSRVFHRTGPSQSSSIILTTVTDVVAFLSFLGLAVLFQNYLA